MAYKIILQENNIDLQTILDSINTLPPRVDGVLDDSINIIETARITKIRDYGCYYNTVLKTVIMPEVVSIGNYAFYKCESLQSVDSSKVESVGSFAFKGNSSLPEINLPLVTQLSNGAFDECISLVSVNLPLVTAIEPLTFRKCEALTAIDLPVVTSIGTQAFYSSGISSLTLRSDTVCTLENSDAFYFTPIEDGTGYIYVPSNLVDSYKTADGWSTYANQIQAIV